MMRHPNNGYAARRRFAFTPLRLLALLMLAGAALAGPPVLAANPLSPRDATAAIGGPFALVDQDGRAVTDAAFRGKWLLVYFGYTHCPDACPTALSDMAEVLDQLDASKRQTVQVLFITVDPARDTPSVMKDYVSAFEGANIVGLTGTQEQVSAAETAYHIQARKYVRADGDYMMSHAATIDIMDPDGRFVAMARPERIGERLAQLLP
jgi:protein SCO1/2